MKRLIRLHNLDAEEQELYQQRLILGRDVEKKKALAAELTFYPDVPKALMSPSELIKKQHLLHRIVGTAATVDRFFEYVEDLVHVVFGIITFKHRAPLSV